MADREEKIQIKGRCRKICERSRDEDELARALNERVYSKHLDAVDFCLTLCDTKVLLSRAIVIYLKMLPGNLTRYLLDI